MQGVVAAIALAGAVVGAMAAGTLSDQFGRRRVIIATALAFIAGSVLSAAAPDLTVLLVGRVVVGIAIGLASMVTPLYLAEIAHAKHRGGVVSLNQLSITIGILTSYLVGFGLAGLTDGWRWMLGLGAVPGIVLALGMFVLPESPRWLAGHGRQADAAAALRQLRRPEEVDAALAVLRSDLKQDGRLLPWSALLARRMRRPLIVGMGLAMFQQITGINTVIYFAPQIFLAAGLSSNSASILATAGIGAVNVALTLVSIRLIDRLGRRVLLLWSLGGMAVALLALAAGFGFGVQGGGLGWLTALSLAGYVAFFAVGLGPVFWLLIAEIFPLALRGRAMSLAAVSNWGFNLLVTLTFLSLIEAFGQVGTFLIYAVLTAVAIGFTAALVPETKGRSLEDIEADLGAAD
jgi:sugar porter (SP) family MFS transporter